MRMFLKGAAIALTLIGTTFATTSAASADGFSISTSNRGRDHTNVGVSFNSGNVAFAYQDGYWDNDRRWHKWRNSREHRDYRDQHRDNYRNGNHRRYHGQGWRRD
jgi:hypothetical protein